MSVCVSPGRAASSTATAKPAADAVCVESKPAAQPAAPFATHPTTTAKQPAGRPPPSSSRPPPLSPAAARRAALRSTKPPQPARAAQEARSTEGQGQGQGQGARQDTDQQEHQETQRTRYTHKSIRPASTVRSSDQSGAAKRKAPQRPAPAAALVAVKTEPTEDEPPRPTRDNNDVPSLFRRRLSATLLDSVEWVCGVCGSDSERQSCLVLCEGCGCVRHLSCLTPPLTRPPPCDFICNDCVQVRQTDREQEATRAASMCLCVCYVYVSGRDWCVERGFSVARSVGVQYGVV